MESGERHSEVLEFVLSRKPDSKAPCWYRHGAKCCRVRREALKSRGISSTFFDRRSTMKRMRCINDCWPYERGFWVPSTSTSLNLSTAGRGCCRIRSEPPEVSAKRSVVPHAHVVVLRSRRLLKNKVIQFLKISCVQHLLLVRCMALGIRCLCHFLPTTSFYIGAYAEAGQVNERSLAIEDKLVYVSITTYLCVLGFPLTPRTQQYITGQRR